MPDRTNAVGNRKRYLIERIAVRPSLSRLTIL